MRTTRVLEKLLCIQGSWIIDVNLDEERREVVLSVATLKRRHFCPRCSFATRASYDGEVRRWRHIGFGGWKVFLEMEVRRLSCPRHAVITEAVPWAEHAAWFTRDFEDMVTWMARQMAKTAIVELVQIAWRTVGKILCRTVDRKLDSQRMDNLVEIGIDEVSYRGGHQYLSVVVDHRTGDVIWLGEGKSADAVLPFFDELGPERSAAIGAVTMDMGPAFIKAVQDKCPSAMIAFDPFHVVKLANAAVDQVRREEVRTRKGTVEGKAIKGTRWTLLKTPDSLLPEEKLRLADVARINQRLYRAYLFKEELRQLYHCAKDTAAEHFEACLAWASRSRIAPLVKLGKTLRKHRAGILAAIHLGLSNGRLEGINNKIGVIKRRSFGFHSAEALMALIYLCCSHVDVPLPW